MKNFTKTLAAAAATCACALAAIAGQPILIPFQTAPNAVNFTNPNPPVVLMNTNAGGVGNAYDTAYETTGTWFFNVAPGSNVVANAAGTGGWGVPILGSPDAQTWYQTGSNLSLTFNGTNQVSGVLKMDFSQWRYVGLGGSTNTATNLVVNVAPSIKLYFKQ